MFWDKSCLVVFAVAPHTKGEPPCLFVLPFLSFPVTSYYLAMRQLDGGDVFLCVYSIRILIHNKLIPTLCLLHSDCNPYLSCGCISNRLSLSSLVAS